MFSGDIFNHKAYVLRPLIKIYPGWHIATIMEDMKNRKRTFTYDAAFTSTDNPELAEYT
jgi:hypothetical protein